MDIFQTVNLIMTVLMALVISFVSLSVFIAMGIGVFLAYKIWAKNRERQKKALDMVLLEVQLPRENEIKIDAAEQMFSAFTGIKGAKGKLGFLKVPDYIVFEIVAKTGDIRFYVSMPKKLQDMVEKQIHGAYPDASIIETEEYDLFTDDSKVSFAGLVTKQSTPYSPIKTYTNLAVDPESTMVSTLGKMQEGESAAIQILITPGGDAWKKAGRAHVTSIKKREANAETAKYNVDQKELEAIEQKLTKPAFNTYIRLVVSSSSKEAADAHLENMITSFTQFSSYNSFSKEKFKYFKGMFMVDFIYRTLPLLKKGSILATDELATIFHFPNKSVESPHIHWLAARSAPAPASIPTEGLYIGKSKYRGHEKPIYIGEDDRRRHMYIIGKTGVGKSEFLKDMILQDIRAGHGVCFIDPHDTIDLILPLIPPERAEDVILFDPSDTERPMGLNMLEATTEEQKHLVVTSIIGLMYKLFDPNQTGIIGPRFEHAVRNAMLTVMSEPGNTFVEVMRVLTDQNFVQELLPKVKDPIIRRYWTDQIAQTSDFHKSEVLDYITSKFGRFVTNTMMRNMIGQSDSSFNFRKAMDEKKILLISLAKGKIGEENSSFLGLVLVPKILVAAMSRQDIPQDQRIDFFLYVDEFQNFATKDFAQILSEARKYRLNLIVANQFIGQIEEEIKNAIFGNVGTIVSFRVGVADANYLQHEFQPTFTEADLINIEARHAYVKTVVKNEPAPPFSMDLTRDLEVEKKMSNPRVTELVKELSRLKYGKPRELVEAEIAKRSKLFEVFGDLGPGESDPFSGEGKLGGGNNSGGMV
ncbi:MAG: TraM recognition domain-containing protein [Candidatus Levybacteria bacterium]|nr:TraM recognition domain-containing protein [Candidatus Levybacteria bacterium]